MRYGLAGALGLVFWYAPQVRTQVPSVAVHAVAERVALPPLPLVPEEPPPMRPLENFGVLAHGSATGDWWRVGAWVEPLPPEVAAMLGASERVGMAYAPRRLRGFEPLRWTRDGLVLARMGDEDVALELVDPGTFELRWRLRIRETWLYGLGWTPRILVREVADPAGFVGYSLVSGREVWRIAVREDAGIHRSTLDDERLYVEDGAQLQAFAVGTGTRLWGVTTADREIVDSLWSDDERLMVWARERLVAVDARTGAEVWSVPVAPRCGVVPGPGVIVVEEMDAYRVVDPASGATLRRFAAPNELCMRRGQHGQPYEPGVTDGRRLVVVESRIPYVRSRDNPTMLRAIDLNAGTEMWRRPMDDVGRMYLDSDALYLVRDSRFDSLHAIDMASGATRAEFSLASDPRARGRSMSFALHRGGSAGAVLTLNSSDSGRWVFGRRTKPVVREVYAIRGRLVGRDHLAKPRVAEVAVRVGDQIVHTDADGRFVARGEGLGGVSVSIAVEFGYTEDGTRLDFAPRTVVLAGVGGYDLGDVALSVRRRCQPREDQAGYRCDRGGG